jgi:hypothetical protein
MMSPVNNKHDMQNKFSCKIITNFKALKIYNPFFAVVFFGYVEPKCDDGFARLQEDVKKKKKANAMRAKGEGTYFKES